jgi:integrase
MAKALTALAIERAKPSSARREIPDGLLRGLYFIVQPSGAKSWAVRYRRRGASRKLTIGQWPAIDLATARNFGAKALRHVAEGGDPATEKQNTKRVTITDSVEAVVADYLGRRVKHQRTVRETERILQRELVPAWRGRRIQDITKRDIIALIDTIDQRAPAMARRTFAIIRAFFGWCLDKDIVSSSPCTGLKPPSKPRYRDRVLSDAELVRVWRAADVIGHPYGLQTKLLILTGCRRAEIADLRWSEVDVEGQMVRLPRERCKNGVAHEVPLSATALAVLASIPWSKSELVFLSANGRTSTVNFSHAKQRLDAVIAKDGGGAMPAWVVHDLRRTVASGLARLGISLPVIEKVLNHSSGSFAGIVGVYQHHTFADEKRRALDAWAAHIERLINPPADNVVDFHTAQVTSSAV